MTIERIRRTIRVIDRDEFLLSEDRIKVEINLPSIFSGFKAKMKALFSPPFNQLCWVGG